MKAAPMKERPGFALMKQTDIQSVYHMQMPRWLFSDPRYMDMNLDTKVTYTFLLNRFQLSRRNGWVNECGEVFVIFPRRELARELRICEQRVTAAFKKLTELKLIWEKRCGRGDANQIYLAAVIPVENTEYSCAPFDYGDCCSKGADIEGLAGASCQEPQDMPFQNGENGVSRGADYAVQEEQILRSSYIEKRKKEFKKKEVSHSVCIEEPDIQALEEELDEILKGCELHCFSRETSQVFENAIERLFYSDSVRIGNAKLPQKRIRSKLHQLDSVILQSVENKLASNLEHNVKNSTAYTMSTIINAIAESESDLMVDPYLNNLRRAPPQTPK